VEPRVDIAAINCRPDPAELNGRWRIGWVVHNAGPQPLELQAAWIPHGRFRGDGRLPLSGRIDPGASRELEFRVTALEAPASVVENAFLILRVRDWRIFVRMRIDFDAAGVPRPSVEAITSQSIE
jgi:hypothetical protein